MTDPRPQFSYYVQQLKERQPDLAYIHVIEPSISGVMDVEAGENESNDFLREIWAPKPYIAGGGYTRESAIQRSEKTHDLIAMGRWFISNVSSMRCNTLGCANKGISRTLCGNSEKTYH